MPEPREKSKACPRPQLERELLRAGTTSVLSSSSEPRRRVPSSPLAQCRGNPRGTRSPPEASQHQRALGAKGVPANRGGVRPKALDVRASNLSAALWAFDPSFHLCPAFKAAHQLCCGGPLPSVPRHLLPSLSTPLPPHRPFLTQTLSQKQLSSLAWRAAFCTSNTPPPSQREGQLLFFSCSQLSSSVGPPHLLLRTRDLEEAGHSRRSGIAPTPGLANRHISSQRIVGR